MLLLTIWASLLGTVVPVGKVDFVKYPLYDGYIRSCSQKEENFGFEVSYQTNIIV